VEVVAIVGLPGSGKTALIQEFSARGFECFDDMNRDWERNTVRMLDLINQKRDIACSDIMFCTRFFRRRLKRTLRVRLHWIFFENNPWQCAKNSLYRYIFQERDRPLLEEIQMIRRLSQVYVPHGDVRSVVIAETQGIANFPAAEINASEPAMLVQAHEEATPPAEPLVVPPPSSEVLQQSTALPKPVSVHLEKRATYIDLRG
jgi:hypothetical protein